jgi:hypothetical protein
MPTTPTKCFSSFDVSLGSTVYTRTHPLLRVPVTKSRAPTVFYFLVLAIYPALTCTAGSSSGPTWRRQAPSLPIPHRRCVPHPLRHTLATRASLNRRSADLDVAVGASAPLARRPPLFECSYACHSHGPSTVNNIKQEQENVKAADQARPFRTTTRAAVLVQMNGGPAFSLSPKVRKGCHVAQEGDRKNSWRWDNWATCCTPCVARGNPQPYGHPSCSCSTPIPVAPTVVRVLDRPGGCDQACHNGGTPLWAMVVACYASPRRRRWHSCLCPCRHCVARPLAGCPSRAVAVSQGARLLLPLHPHAASRFAHRPSPPPHAA